MVLSRRELQLTLCCRMVTLVHEGEGLESQEPVQRLLITAGEKRELVQVAFRRDGEEDWRMLKQQNLSDTVNEQLRQKARLGGHLWLGRCGYTASTWSCARCRGFEAGQGVASPLKDSTAHTDLQNQTYGFHFNTVSPHGPHSLFGVSSGSTAPC